MATPHHMIGLYNLLAGSSQPSQTKCQLTGKMFVTDYRAWDRVLSELTGRPVVESTTTSASLPPESQTPTQAHSPRTGIGGEVSAAR